MTEVFLLTVEDSDVGLIHSSVHSSRERAQYYLAAYCRGQWEAQGHGRPLSADDDRAIERYFEFWDEEMDWDIAPHQVDPDLTEVDHSPEFASEDMGEDDCDLLAPPEEGEALA